MPPDPDKSKMRKLKQTIKRRGSKHRRAELKKNLAENPEEAAHAEENLGRYSSETMNGMDKDSTRRRDGE